MAHLMPRRRGARGQPGWLRLRVRVLHLSLRGLSTPDAGWRGAAAQHAAACSPAAPAVHWEQFFGAFGAALCGCWRARPRGRSRRTAVHPRARSAAVGARACSPRDMRSFEGWARRGCMRCAALRLHVGASLRARGGRAGADALAATHSLCYLNWLPPPRRHATEALTCACSAASYPRQGLLLRARGGSRCSARALEAEVASPGRYRKPALTRPGT
jgi:hypothetical protein